MGKFCLGGPSANGVDEDARGSAAPVRRPPALAPYSGCRAAEILPAARGPRDRSALLRRAAALSHRVGGRVNGRGKPCPPARRLMLGLLAAQDQRVPEPGRGLSRT